MSKFNKLVEEAKKTAEIGIIQEVGYSGNAFLPKDGNELISHLGDDWYFSILSIAGYSNTTIERKIRNMDYDKLASKLDDWYKTEVYPKLFNTFKSQGKNIYDLSGNPIYCPTNNN